MTGATLGHGEVTGATLESVTTRQQVRTARRRLMLVADNSSLFDSIRTGFRTSGEFKLTGSVNGRRATAQTILGMKPEVILLDDMDQSERSIQLLRGIRAEDREVAVIMLSAQLDQEWLDHAFGAGATAVISKATRPAAFPTLVRETLSGHIVHRPPAAAPPTASPTRAVPSEDLPLTRRELELLHFVSSGSSNGDVAQRLWVTDETVKFHLRNIYRKLEAANRAQASNFAYASGMIDFAATSDPRVRLAAA